MFFGIDLTDLLQLVGYPGVFAIIFAESGLIFAFFLPGATLLFTAGLLAATGIFNPFILIPLVTLAAILGDNVGYWFGNKVGIRLFTRPDSRFFHQEHLRRTQHFYEKHGAKAIFIARFIPIIRTFTPIVAGIASMNYRTFLTFNILGALAWATGITTIAYALGTRFPFIGDYIEIVLIGIFVVTLTPLFWEMFKQYRNAKNGVV